jgi:hypothetical protein
MTTIQQSSITNVEATLNDAFSTALSGFTFPAAYFSQQPGVVMIAEEAEPTLPAYSLNHINVSSDDVGTEGTYRAMSTMQIMEVNAWVSRASANWLAQLRFMVDTIHTWRSLNHSTIRIKDFAANPSSPSTTAFLIQLGEVNLVATSPDPNPDIERRRVLVYYRFYYRA